MLAYFYCITMVFALCFNFDFFNTSQGIGWKEHLHYDLFGVQWDVKS